MVASVWILKTYSLWYLTTNALSYKHVWCWDSAVKSAAGVVAFLRAWVWVTHVWCWSVNSDLLKESFVWHLAKVKGSYFTATLAIGNSIDFVVRSLWFVQEGEGHTQSHTKPTLHTTTSILSVNHSLISPPCAHSYLHSAVAQVTGYSLVYIQQYILSIVLSDMVQWVTIKSQCCNQTLAAYWTHTSLSVGFSGGGLNFLCPWSQIPPLFASFFK